MNVPYFLTPKSEVTYLYDDFTLRQAIEKFKTSGYSAIPVISREGKYTGTVNQGDFLWEIMKFDKYDIKNFEHIPLSNIIKRNFIKPVKITAEIDNLIFAVLNQNFVPVVDDNEIFIGIVTRKTILNYYLNNKIIQKSL